MTKAVFLRLDKIGDLIATMPVDQLPWLKKKNVEIQWVLAQGLGLIAKVAEPERQFIELDLRDPKSSRRKLLEFLRREKPDAVVVFYAPWWVGYVCWRARVPLRVGRRSQWHSFLFFNRGLRQKRSLAEKHEADYNRELVEYAFSQAAGETPVLHLNPPIRRHLFEKHDLQPGKYFIVHPGMAGSALNWPQSHYNTLIEKLINAGTVVITGTASDEPYLNEIKPQWEMHPNVRWLQNQLTLEDLMSLLKAARGVVAPSTGVLHLAAACGTRSVGIYSPLQAHSSDRWGPRGPHALALSPRDGYFSTLSKEADGKTMDEKTIDASIMEEVKVNDVIKGLEL